MSGALALGVALAALGVAALAGAAAIAPDYAGDTGARTFPAMAGGALVVLGVLQAFGARRSGSKPRSLPRAFLVDDGGSNRERDGGDANAPSRPGRAVGEAPADERAADARSASGRVPAVIALIVAVCAYAWLIGQLGYLLSTALAAPAFLAIFGVRSPVGLALAAIVCPLAYHVVFFELLGVFPPHGEWFDLAAALRARVGG